MTNGNMDDLAFQRFRARSLEKERPSNEMVEGPSVQKMSQELERLFAPPTVETVTEEEKDIESDAPPTVETVTEEEKDIESEIESQDAEHLFTSAIPAIPVTPSPVSTPTKPETETPEETPKEATYVEIDEISDTIEEEKNIII